MNVVAAVKSLDRRAMLLCEEQDVCGLCEQALRYRLIEADRMYPSLAKHPRGWIAERAGASD
jgi:hypothetical protein